MLCVRRYRVCVNRFVEKVVSSTHLYWENEHVVDRPEACFALLRRVVHPGGPPEAVLFFAMSA